MDVSKRKRVYWLGFVLLLFIVYLFISDDVTNNVTRYNGNPNYATQKPQQYNSYNSANEDEGKLLDKLVENEEREHQDGKKNSNNNDESGSNRKDNEIENNSSQKNGANNSGDNSEKDVF